MASSSDSSAKHLKKSHMALNSTKAFGTDSTRLFRVDLMAVDIQRALGIDSAGKDTWHRFDQAIQDGSQDCELQTASGIDLLTRLLKWWDILTVDSRCASNELCTECKWNWIS
ncbi:hypothetical protein G6F42_020280 [Rhizopus arrhizus]|nr:hypothetical protein G6F42_020280 [Rhizopus arrhizus]